MPHEQDLPEPSAKSYPAPQKWHSMQNLPRPKSSDINNFCFHNGILTR